MKFIAELSCNHNGSWRTMESLIRSAASIGCDYVKIQLFEPSDMTLKRYTEQFLIPDGPWKGRYLWDLYEKVKTPKSWLGRIKELVEELEIGLIVSVFSPDTVEEVGDVMFKVASPEISYEGLLYALQGKKVLLSTGLATEEDIEVALEIVNDIVLLHCVSDYPTDLTNCNVSTLLDLRKYDRPLGLSDHSLGFIAPVMAAAYGAEYIEKHLKLGPCPDEIFSMYPLEFRAMMEAVEAAEKTIGKPIYGGGRYKRKMVDGEFVRTVT